MACSPRPPPIWRCSMSSPDGLTAGRHRPGLARGPGRARAADLPDRADAAGGRAGRDPGGLPGQPRRAGRPPGRSRPWAPSPTPISASPPACRRPRRSPIWASRGCKFGNGVVLYFKPTPFEAGKVQVAVRFGSGRIGMPQDEPGLDLLAGRGFVDGGLGRHSIDEISASWLPVRSDIDLVVGESGVNLVGTTTPADLPLQLDLLGGLRDRSCLPAGGAGALPRPARHRPMPGWRRRPTGWSAGRWRVLLHGGDRGSACRPRPMAERRTLAELRDWLDPMLQHGPMQVDRRRRRRSGPGDRGGRADVRRACRRAAGHGPSGAATRLCRAPPSRCGSPIWAPRSQALALVYWPTDGSTTHGPAIGLDLVADILTRPVAARGARARGRHLLARSLQRAVAGAAGLRLSRRRRGREHRRRDARSCKLMLDVGAALQRAASRQDEFDRALQPRLAQAATPCRTTTTGSTSYLIGMEQYPQLLDDARDADRRPREPDPGWRAGAGDPLPRSSAGREGAGRSNARWRAARADRCQRPGTLGREERSDLVAATCASAGGGGNGGSGRLWPTQTARPAATWAAWIALTSRRSCLGPNARPRR